MNQRGEPVRISRGKLYQKALVLLLVLAFFVLGFVYIDQPVKLIQSAAQLSPFAVGATFALMMFIATVIAPVAVMPVLPVVAIAIGPIVTGIISVVSWTAGAVVAFLLARYFGRPIIGRFVSLETIDKYERYVPDRAQFFWIILLRMVLPVDVLSYAIGMFSRISLLQYTLATIIGVTPFSFIVAYLGPAFVEGRFLLLGVLALSIVIAAGIGVVLSQRGLKKGVHEE